MPSIPSPRGRNTGGLGGLVCLVDVNNFYASCERVFDPGLEGRPVVVLSNNDGCIIARSQEAKDLGIPMGEPVHKVKDFLRRERVHVYSSNYALYGDMSARVVAVLKRFTPYLEVYSIDESFLDLTGFADPAAHGRAVKDAVHRWTGLPVSVGTGATKTLAKIANRTAKKDPGLGGVFVMPSDPADEVTALRSLATSGYVDGLCLAYIRENDQRIDLMESFGLPFIVHGRFFDAPHAYPSLDVDNEAAFYDATRLLLQLGHRRIALINGDENFGFAIRRRDGVARAHARAAEYALRILDEPANQRASRCQSVGGIDQSRDHGCSAFRLVGYGGLRAAALLSGSSRGR